jgi:hypothetical protein
MGTLNDQRTEPVVLETERHRIEGNVTLARDGYRSRLTELLNAAEQDFLPLTDATVTPLDGGGEPEHHAVVVVSRRHVVLAVPASRDAV